MFVRQVKTENGWVRGLAAADPRITSYKGIPFAAPPVGENRWRAPQPCESWEGVLNAYDFKPISMQDVPPLDDRNVYTREWSVDPDIAMSEDCLYLNIWTPAREGTEKLPVFVWYFGGGLQVGHPSEMEFDGERIARRGVVVVTVNYRLNCFGFLCHPEITAEAPNAPANWGHLDQQAGTRWVKRNIAAFGGDPDNITIGGQSAGGMSVMAQLTSPQNEGLFQQAIIESGVAANVYPQERAFGYVPPLEEAEQTGEMFFRFMGVSTLAEARALDAQTVLQKMKEFRRHWGTVADQQFCVGDYNLLFLRNQRLMVPVLLGHTDSEFFIRPSVKTREEFISMARNVFAEDAEEFLALSGVENGSLEQALENVSVSAVELAIRIMSACNHRTGAETPLYYYTFAAEIPGWDHPGTFHSVDLWFFFETLAKCWRPFVGKHYDLARQMCDYWTEFMRKGDPNGEDTAGGALPAWPRLAEEKPCRMRFGDVPAAEDCAPSPVMALLVRAYLRRNGL